MRSGVQLFENDLSKVRSNPSLFVTSFMFSGTPRFLPSESDFQEWRHLLAEELEVDPISLHVVGSAQLGYSLNPKKNFKEFTFERSSHENDLSDFDIAVVDNTIFDVAWSELQEKMSSSIRTEQIGYYRKLVFEECIGLDTLLPIFSFGQKWSVARDNFIRNLGSDYLHLQLNFRLYRNHAALRRYQIKSVATAITSTDYMSFKDEHA